ncbi:D-serine ammonia-lyase, partial [Planococcus sp. SIMBA_143]
QHPIIGQMAAGESVFWKNEYYTAFETDAPDAFLKREDIMEADRRLSRFARFMESAFPETKAQDGIIESPLVHADGMKDFLGERYGTS